LQMLEDIETATRFVRAKFNPPLEMAVTGAGHAHTLAQAVSEVLPNIKLLPSADARAVMWSEIVNHKIELWPIQYLLPGGAYLH